VTEAAAAIVAVQLLHDPPRDLLDTLHDELRDSIAASHVKSL
jgi:hypothetical protein